MPAPIIEFIPKHSPEQRALALDELQAWCSAKELSRLKAVVLQAVIGYARKHFTTEHLEISAKWTDFGKKRLSAMFQHNQPDQKKSPDYLKRMSICESIFQKADLSHLFFVQYVINQINLIKNSQDFVEDTDLNAILSLAETNKKTLMIPLINQSRQAIVGLTSFGAVWFGKPGFILAGAIIFAFSEHFVDWRLQRSLENKLALDSIGGEILHVNDGFDEILDTLSQFTSHGITHVKRLFQHIPVVVEEAKEIIPAVLTIGASAN